MSINVHIVPILSDNYAYILEGADDSVAVVDPGEAAPVIKYLEEHGLTPTLILITHHHWDHVNGVDEILERFPCSLAGADPEGSAPDSPAKKVIKARFDEVLYEGCSFSFAGEEAQTLSTPGHTPEHLCYYFKESGFVLCGDVMFSMGCGRILDGSAEELYGSLQKLGALPDETLIYCGHEYTQSNADFCLKIEPDNKALQKRSNEVNALRAKGLSTLPSTLSKEKETNLFLKAKSPQAFKELRTLKDRS